MATEITVPDIGDFESVEIIEILVKPGDTIKKNDPVVTLESDKSSVEVPSSFAGKISALKVKIGDKVSTGSVLALIDDEKVKVEQQSSEQEQEKTKPQVLKEDNQVIGSVIFLNVSREIIKKRIMGRIVCVKCNVILNEFFNKDEIDLHQCGKKYLKKRDDDNQQTVITRYNTYMEKTKPLLDLYSSKESFYEIDASLKIEVIAGKIDKILNV